jgi:butyryl-CoA dehydrogenase
VQIVLTQAQGFILRLHTAYRIRSRATSGLARRARQVNNKDGVGVLYKIVDCAWMAFSSVHNRQSARAVFRPRNSATSQMVSETKKFVTESCQKVVHNSMQVVGGIGYTSVFPLERIYRDIRLASIWTGTNEIMATIVAHEWYREAAAQQAGRPGRDYAADAPEANATDEIIYG